MSEDNVDWKKVLENTSIIRFPKQKLATFGNTSINYYVITEPLYDPIGLKMRFYPDRISVFVKALINLSTSSILL